jgi:hypothetical protein
LTTWTNAADHIGKTFEGFKVDHEMADAVQVYLDTVREIASKEDIEMKRKILKVEERFSLAWLHPEMSGSNDAMVYDVTGKKLYVLDYKHGSGIPIAPDWNSQLMMYGLGACHALWMSQSETTRRAIKVMQMIDEVELIIVQPRAQGEAVKRWTISVHDLFFWGMHVLAPAGDATEKKDAPLRSGHHCRFCPALAVCPEQIKQACAVAKTDFERPILPDPSFLTPEDIVKIMSVAETFSAWANEVKAYAQSLAEGGTELPGFKLVAKRANRSWTDEEHVAAVLEGVLGDAAYERNVISIAKAEKALKRVGVSPEATLQGLWSKPDNGVVLVPESDSRKAVVAHTAAALDFMDLGFLD